MVSGRNRVLCSGSVSSSGASWLAVYWRVERALSIISSACWTTWLRALRIKNRCAVNAIRSEPAPNRATKIRLNFASSFIALSGREYSAAVMRLGAINLKEDSMHWHRLAAFLFGCLILGSAFMIFVATQNFATVDRVLAAPPQQAEQMFQTLGPGNARVLLRY